jgi:hypothetical protein
MLIQMIRQDISKFVVIYMVCLVWFSHMLNIVRDKQNTGLEGFWNSAKKYSILRELKPWPKAF